MDKRMVFIYMDAVPEEVDFEKLTDLQVYCIMTTSRKDDIMVFDSMESFIDAFNKENCPSDVSWWARVIDFDLYKHLDAVLFAHYSKCLMSLR